MGMYSCDYWYRTYPLARVPGLTLTPGLTLGLDLALAVHCAGTGMGALATTS